MTLTRIKVSAECEWKPGVDGEFYFASMVDAELDQLRADNDRLSAQIAALESEIDFQAKIIRDREVDYQLAEIEWELTEDDLEI